MAKAEKKFADKEQKINKDAQDLAEKYQKGLITTRDAQAKEQDLQKRATTLQSQMQKEIPALQEEQQVLSNRINDLIKRAIQSINADRKYKMIVNSASLLDADESLNITEQVLAMVNEFYASEKKK
jgi:outer membrane protein